MENIVENKLNTIFKKILIRYGLQYVSRFFKCYLISCKDKGICNYFGMVFIFRGC
jgi:hypothetical protein